MLAITTEEEKKKVLNELAIQNEELVKAQRTIN